MRNIIIALLFVACLGGVIYSATVAGSSIEPAPHDVASMMQLHSSRTPYDLATLSLTAEIF